MAKKTWFITGASRGFGRQWAESALERGDRVAATARDRSALAALSGDYRDQVLTLTLDVTDRAAVQVAVARAHSYFGRLDVVVNNAGYGLFGAVEEVTEAEARAQIETNLFGALWVTQAALPYLRSQRAGHIVQVSSLGGVIAFPDMGLYHASKWGLEGFSEALAQEVAEFGIHVTLVEPGGFETDWSGSSAVRAEPLSAYDRMRERIGQRRANVRRGDPAATGSAMLEIVDAEPPPLRVLFGALAPGLARDHYLQRLKVWDEWEELAHAAHGRL